MRGLLSTFLFLAPLAAQASGMTPVPKSTGYCQSSDETYCFEWSLAKDQAIRFIARGDEDVIEYSFYRVASGRYDRLGDVHPVLRDNARAGQLFWAYPWDITDIDIAPGPKLLLLASFDHTFTVSDEYGATISHKRIPAVLFIGHTAQPEASVEPIDFKPMPLSCIKNGG